VSLGLSLLSALRQLALASRLPLRYALGLRRGPWVRTRFAVGQTAAGCSATAHACFADEPNGSLRASDDALLLCIAANVAEEGVGLRALRTGSPPSVSASSMSTDDQSLESNTKGDMPRSPRSTPAD